MFGVGGLAAGTTGLLLPHASRLRVDGSSSSPKKIVENRMIELGSRNSAFVFRKRLGGAALCVGRVKHPTSDNGVSIDDRPVLPTALHTNAGMRNVSVALDFW